MEDPLGKRSTSPIALYFRGVVASLSAGRSHYRLPVSSSAASDRGNMSRVNRAAGFPGVGSVGVSGDRALLPCVGARTTERLG
ncbi:MAG: hypothetical protein F6K42_31165 [Leptolyngbya sp. SIO1D8]|nr:hypothetical protein [Leptolyngbya sp. SIO1D8]